MTTQAEKAGFRPEIQGLRAIAVVSVLIFHIWPTALPGGFVGVDVFFVISGFLITEVLLRDVRNTGSISIARFYGRRIKRLLPAGTLVLLATAICYELLPSVSWKDHADQLLASTLYYQNWWLGFQAVDYLGAEHAPGPLQHFWSLSVEEQYYLVWPLLFLAARLIFTRSKRDPVTVLRWSIGLVFFVSLVHSIYYSHSNPGMAYFASTTRAWELALGGLLAVSTVRSQLLPSRRIALSAAGLTLILASFFVIDSASIFPGYIALLPTLGTAIVIMAGDSPSRLSGQALLRTPVFQYLGDISYSLYLWHWPVIIFYQHISGRAFTIVDALIVMVVSCALAHQTKVLVEDPFRQANYWKLGQAWPYVLGCLCISLTILGSMYVDRAYQSALEASPADQIAGNITPSSTASNNATEPYRPTALQAREDRPEVALMGCHTSQAEENPRVCTFGEDASGIHIALVGDSHAVQWAPAFREIAAANGWKFTILTKSACAFASITVSIGKPARPYDECSRWSEATEKLLKDLKPSHIVIGQSIGQWVYGANNPVESAEQLANEYAAIWTRIAEGGVEVIAIRDTPRMSVDIPECLSTPGKSVDDCSRRRAGVLDRDGHPDPIVLAAQQMPTLHLLDFSNLICNSRTCPAVANGILRWRDSHHLTATFVRELKPQVAAALEPIMSRDVAYRSGSAQNPTPGENARSVSATELAQAKADLPPIYADKCIYSKNGTDVKVCEYGSHDADRHIVLAGDTRAGQWLPALLNLTDSQPLRISTIITSACPLGDMHYKNRDCAQWTTGVINSIKSLDPDVVIFSQSRGYRIPEADPGVENAEALAKQFAHSLTPLSDLSARIVVIPDTPRMSNDVNKCLSTNVKNKLLACSVSKHIALPSPTRPDPLILVAHQQDNVMLLNPANKLCPADGYNCLPMIDGQLVWRSKYLVTASFAASVADEFYDVLFPN